MRFLTSSRVAVCSLALLACLSPARAPVVPIGQIGSTLQLEDGDELSGQLLCENLEIPVTARVTVTGDLHVVASGDVLIFGELVARDSESGQAGVSDPHAPDIRIDCEGMFHVSHTGILAGGEGASLMTSEESERIYGDGGDGSSILVQCRTWTTCGTIIAGEGGRAGLGGTGGSGGDIRVTGWAGLSPESCTHLERGNVIGASGGRGGFGVNEPDLLVLPGVPGRSGDVMCLEPDSSAPPGPDEDPSTEGDPQDGMLAPPLRDACQPLEGDSPSPTADIIGSSGTNGQKGPDGIFDRPNGLPGTRGSAAGAVVGTNGGAGGPGADCCGDPPQPGGDGGDGADGASVTGGKGGDGGPGGDAYLDPFLHQYCGDGGKGGNAGAGANGTGGKGGAAGAAGDGCSPGAVGNRGSGGSGQGGDAGTPGAGGAGIQNGVAGDPATSGNGIAGEIGGPGSFGVNCCEQQ